jgi:hypothetical protein
MHKALTCALLLGIAACSREPAAPAQPTPTATATPPTMPPETGPTMRTLAGTLRAEASRRPTVGLRAETVFAALADAGVVVDAPHQYLGATARADYCAGGTTADGLAVAVCEYASAEAAAAGRDHVERRYAAMNSFREIHVRGATTLTLTTAPARPLGPSARRAADAFASL